MEHHVESPNSTVAWFHKKIMIVQPFFMISLSLSAVCPHKQLLNLFSLQLDLKSVCNNYVLTRFVETALHLEEERQTQYLCRGEGR